MVAPISDISSRVSNELLDDPRTRDFGHQIEVIADRGIITLSGIVPSEEAREAAVEIARRAHGVISVHNELKVKG